MLLVWIVLACCVCAAAAALLRAYRRLLALDARCEAAAAAIDAEIAGRHAMLPALVGVARVFAPETRDAIEIVVKAHAAAQRAASPQAQLLAQTRLGDGVRQLLAAAENAPQLQALPEFWQLRAALEETERRLWAARRALSVAIEDYNHALARFPASLFALRLRLTPRAFYDIGAESALLEQAAA